VFARTTPKQKLEIVKAFQARGECVAVTGDGVNDSPALRQADCGIAMGSGSEVSKEAADLIILDDRFTNVVLGVQHGRRCFANLKKVIIYLLPAGSWSEMLPVMTNVFLGMPLALSSFLMIVICCCTDVGPSLAMVYEKPESSIMRVPPRRIGRDHLVTGKLILNAYLFIGMIEAAVAYATFFSYFASRHGLYPSDLLFKFGDTPDGTETGQCFYFYALVVMQFGNALTSRTARVPAFRASAFVGPTKNLRFLLAFLVSTVVFFVTCYVPFIQTGLNTTGLTANWQPLLIPWLGAAGLVCSNEARKFIAERFPGGCMAKLAWE
jgi:sodium/potassium-transporting ATPase subunit alpha